MKTPRTRYARSGDGVHIAYQVVGDGPIDLLYVPTWISHLEVMWEHPLIASFFERLASFSRLIMFDRRGSGLSDPIREANALEQQMDDVNAVLRAAGAGKPALLAQLEGGPMAMLYAASHPDRVQSLVLYATFARTTRSDDIPWGNTEAERAPLIEARLQAWGTGEGMVALAPSVAGDDELREWFGKLERLAAPPGVMHEILGHIGETDVRSVLGSIRVPTLVVNRAEDRFVDPRHARYLAERIPGARHLELPGADTLPMMGASDELLDEVEEFLTGSRSAHEPDRVLATVMFTDIVDSTKVAAELGDSEWRSMLERHDAFVRWQLAGHRGKAVKSTGDGFLATFDGPARAIRCAQAITEGVREFGLEIRAGLHTGEIEVLDDDVAGMAVHIGARVGARADAGEVLVSGTVRDLVVGSGIDFADRGEHELKGVPGEWRLYAVDAVGAVAA